MRTPRVFVVNEPLRKDDASGALERFLPIERAAEHGEIVKLTPDGSPPGNIATWLRMIDDGLAAWEDGDFLVLVGDQGLLAYAAAVVGHKIARLDQPGNFFVGPEPVLRALKWSRHKSAYDAVNLAFSSPTPAESART